MSETNPLFDGTLEVKIGGLDVTAALLPGFSYSNTNPGGFGECPMQLPAVAPWGAYNAAVVKGAAVTVKHGAGPVTLFEGAVTNDVSHAVVEGGVAYYDITCAGLWWKAGLRKDYCAIFGDDDPSQWFELGTNAKAFQIDTGGKLEIRLEEGQSAKANKPAYLYYWINSGMGDPAATIGYLVAQVHAVVNATKWFAVIESSDSPWGTWAGEYQFNNETYNPGYPEALAIGAGKSCIRIGVYCDENATGPANDVYISLSNVSVLSDANTAGYSSFSTTDPVVFEMNLAQSLQTGDRVLIKCNDASAPFCGFQTLTRVDSTHFSVAMDHGVGTNAGVFYWPYRLDDALSEIAVTTGLATSSDLDADGIGNVNWGLNVRDHMGRAEAIDMLAATNVVPIDYGFWDDATFLCKGRAAPAAGCDYLIDASDPGIDFNVFAGTEDSPTVVKLLVSFRNNWTAPTDIPDGTVLAIYREEGMGGWGSWAGDWDDASIVVDVWDEWSDLMLEAMQAMQLADQILAWIGSNKYQGSITIATPTVPLRTGGTKLTAYIRAGDYIEASNLATGPLQISSYVMDPDSGVATLGIGETRRDFVRRATARVRGQYEQMTSDPNRGQ